MESLKKLLPLIHRNEWAATIDLSDAYLHVPVAQSSQRLLGFTIGKKTFVYQVLPFGLWSSPRVFTLIVRSVAAALRQRGIQIFCYLDDWLLLAPSEQTLRDQLQTTVSLVTGLGFLINWEKSEVNPTRTPDFLGAVIDIPQLRAAPAPHSVEKIRERAPSLLSSQQSSVKDWQIFLGLLASLGDVVAQCRMRMRILQLHLFKFHCPLSQTMHMKIPMTPKTPEAIQWWIQPSSQEKETLPGPSSNADNSDGCIQAGLGAVMDSSQAGGGGGGGPLEPPGRGLAYQQTVNAGCTTCADNNIWDSVNCIYADGHTVNIISGVCMVISRLLVNFIPDHANKHHFIVTLEWLSIYFWNMENFQHYQYSRLPLILSQLSENNIDVEVFLTMGEEDFKQIGEDSFGIWRLKMLIEDFCFSKEIKTVAFEVVLYSTFYPTISITALYFVVVEIFWCIPLVDYFSQLENFVNRQIPIWQQHYMDSTQGHPCLKSALSFKL